MRLGFASWSLVVVLAACADGQSGSENVPQGPTSPEPIPPPGIPGPTHCPCSNLRGYQMIRARVVGAVEFPEVGTTRYELEAEALLGPDPTGRDELEVGDHFGGYWQGDLACGGAVDVATDSTVLAFFRRGDQDGFSCCEFISCATECDPNEQEEATRLACEQGCETQTQAACDAHADEALLRGTLMLIPWGDELLIGRSDAATATITPAELSALSGDQASCEMALIDASKVLEPPAGGKEPDEPSGGPPPSIPGSPVPPPTSATPPSGTGTTPTPSPAPSGSPTPPATAPAPTATTPPATPLPPNTSAPPGVATTEPGAPPPAHPEEVRVRCATP